MCITIYIYGERDRERHADLGIFYICKWINSYACTSHIWSEVSLLFPSKPPSGLRTQRMKGIIPIRSSKTILSDLWKVYLTYNLYNFKHLRSYAASMIHARLWWLNKIRLTTPHWPLLFLSCKNWDCLLVMDIPKQ